MPATFDIEKKYVRVMNTRSNGLIEFEFVIGDEQISVELIMTADAFQEFCQRNAVKVLQPGELLPAEQQSAAEGEWHWNLHQATHERFRSSPPTIATTPTTSES